MRISLGIHLILWGVLVFFPCACEKPEQGPKSGGPCVYEGVEGVAAIIQIKEIDTESSYCKNEPVELYFKFTPNDPKAVDSYRWPDLPDGINILPTEIGMELTRKWLVANGLVEGSKQRCIRMEDVSDACPSPYFEFPDIDFTDAKKACKTE